VAGAAPREAESDWSREQIEGTCARCPAPSAAGQRLKPESWRSPSGHGHNIAELCSLSIDEAVDLFGALELTEREEMIADRV
jgi:excinuclease ABC subunit A